MFTLRVHLPVLLALAILPTVSHGQGTPVAPPTTLWRFMGIPQGFQRVRDVVTNRRGNRPGLERRDPLKRIADPANLESDNPAIKAAAEVKQAEDMKAQKIKAIKYLATIGCGCYDKDGKITKALLAATDDCTPDVREAAIEAIEDAAGKGCCKKCGSTSCCSEEVTKRLSEMAYERGDDGCPIEPNADIRKAAARVLKICCPGGPPSGPILEEVPEPGPEPVPVPEETVVPGEGSTEELSVPGETNEEARFDRFEENGVELSQQMEQDETESESLEFRFHPVTRSLATIPPISESDVQMAIADAQRVLSIESNDSAIPAPIRRQTPAASEYQSNGASRSTAQSSYQDNAPTPVRAIALPSTSQAVAKPVTQLTSAATESLENAPAPVRAIPLPVK